MRADGTTVRAGIFVHSAYDVLLNITVEWTGNAALEGTANYDNDGDYLANGSIPLVNVDCSTLTPP